MQQVILLLACYGLCFGLMNEKVPALNRALEALPFFRDEKGDNVFARLFSCAYCTGFHAGWLVWLTWRVSDQGLNWGWPPTMQMVVFAFASSAFCYFVDTMLCRLER